MGDRIPLYRYGETQYIKPGLKGLFNDSATRGGSDYTMRRVVRLESSGEILGAN